MKRKIKLHPPSKKEKLTLRFLIVIGLLSIINFAFWFFSLELIDNALLFGLLTATLAYSAIRVLYEWYHYWSISTPEKKNMKRHLTVDMLTTYFPGEPYDMIENTLEAMKNVRYPHTTILCDEANDPRLIDFCKRNDIVHVTRDNRIDAKAGNINNALRTKAKGDICVILDPDHVPAPEFLDPILPYFEDPDIGYVQIVQAYKNLHESYVAKGAAQQTFHFYGPMMMGMNSYGTVNAIGANCTFRRAALDSIGGHAPGLAEDMHTSMQLHAKGWKSVYLPRVLARGLVPSSLTAYYKQQLKWSRGTMELLFRVYPKLFKNFNWRQRLHYASLPLHYLIGFFYLINFLIPIIALTTSTTPWKGNMVFFGFICIPLIASVILVRTYVQRWVMEESERGFHVVGGLLQITAWWVFCVGIIYTFFKKKVPYLPTPKTGEDKTSWKILAPNIIMGLLSIAAIAYGLLMNLTPFSILMSGFALLNAFFMFFTIYLGSHRSRNIEMFEEGLSKKWYAAKHAAKVRFYHFRHGLYRVARKTALPLMIFSCVISALLVYQMNYLRWEGVTPRNPLPRLPVKSLGIYHPSLINGPSDMASVDRVEKALKLKFDIISHYVPWGDSKDLEGLTEILDNRKNNDYTPMITWEPWASNFSFSREDDQLSREREVYRQITRGTFDTYIDRFAEEISNYENPVYIRFAHEFDNPDYPWSKTGGNNSQEFKRAWRYVWNRFKDQGVTNVSWIWNPWKSEAIKNYYPGDAYVDFVGITGLNYSDILGGQGITPFERIYNPFREALLDAQIDKPVIIAEFGSLNLNGHQNDWLMSSLESIFLNYQEIKSIVFFNSNIDQNIPDHIELASLDWSINDPDSIKLKLWELKDAATEKFQSFEDLEPRHKIQNYAITKNIRGVNYKKGQNWYKNYQVLDRNTLDQDFNLMKDIGLNQVKYYGSEIYHYNFFRLIREKGLKVSYGLWLPENNNFQFNRRSFDEIKTEFIKKIRELKSNPDITSWYLGNDLLSSYYNKLQTSEIYNFQQDYLEWLNSLIADIKAEDPNRPVIVEIDANAKAIYHTRLLQNQVEGIDALGLVVRDPEAFKLLRKYLSQEKIAFLISDIDPELLPEIQNGSFYLRNWQDQRESDVVSFDGLLDNYGNKKTAYRDLLHSYRKIPADYNKLKIRVLKPADLVGKNKTMTYHAMKRHAEDKNWKYIKNRNPYSLEWFLVKNDDFGNHLAIKKLGETSSIDVKIPENYQNYQLILRYKDDGYVKDVLTSLNIPLLPSE
ncbi:glycosyltransferase [Robertkochia aurantiaca]|uniref:glycosyltransferase n=1 Tax=Robertkochia aurantiaca TaxID=2873700 RepID=UPI001CCE0885|nr:glycosyltransferase [Robertkochia sp. 3YJGBD-33]